MQPEAAAPPPAPAASRSRSIPRLVWAITGLHVGLMLCFSLLYPPFTQFDETQHVDAVISLRYGDGWPPPGHRQLSEGVLQAATPVLRGVNHLPFTDDPLPPRSQRPSLESLGGDRPNSSYPVPNQMTQHPPAYYALGAAVLAVFPGSGGWPAGLTVEVLRLLSILLFAPVPLLAWAVARVLRASSGIATVAAALPLTSPQLERVGASVNNDALLTLSFGVAVLLLARVATGDLRRRTALLLGAALGVALLTKGFALALLPGVAVAYLVARRRGRPAPGAWWQSGLLSLIVAFVIGGWWWLNNLVVYGQVQPSGIPARFRLAILGGPLTPGDDSSAFALGAFRRLSVRFWGSLGINYAPPEAFSPRVTDTLVVVSVAAIIAAFIGLRRSRWALTAAVLLPFLGTLAVLVVGIYGGYKFNGSYPGAQGRYLFGSLPGLAAAVALGLGVALGRARRLLLPAVVFLAFALQLLGLRSVLRHQWLEAVPGRSYGDRLSEALHGIARWSPFPSAVGAGFAVLTAFAAVVVLVAALASAAQRDLELVQEPLVDDGDVTAVDGPLDDLEDDRLGSEDGVHDSPR